MKKIDVMHGTLATAGEHYIEESKKLTDAVHAYGTKIVLQIASGAGRNRKKGFFLDNDPVSASENPNIWDPSIIHRALTTEEVKFLIESYAKGAYIAKLDIVFAHIEKDLAWIKGRFQAKILWNLVVI